MKLRPELKELGLEFNKTTKLLVSSRLCKLNGHESLMMYVLARVGFLVSDVFYLNTDTALVRVDGAENSDFDNIPKDLMDGPFKIRRVFKSGIFKTIDQTNRLFGSSSVNFLRLLATKRNNSGEFHSLSDPINISIVSDSSEYKKKFFEFCAKELDSDPVKYEEFDLVPAGNVEFNIRHFDVPRNRTMIVTWASGKYWTN